MSDQRQEVQHRRLASLRVQLSRLYRQPRKNAEDWLKIGLIRKEIRKLEKGEVYERAV